MNSRLASPRRRRQSKAVATRTAVLVVLATTSMTLLLSSGPRLLPPAASVVDAYVTSPGALPPRRQRQWLQKLTDELVEVEPGQLSPQELARAPDLIYAWSTCPSDTSGSSRKGNASNSNSNKKKKQNQPSAQQDQQPQQPRTTDAEKNALAVEALVKRMVDERRAGSPAATIDALLTTDEYNCLLEGWAKAGLGEAAAERCEQILEGMQTNGPRPNLQSFKACLLAWRQASLGYPPPVVEYSPLRMQRLLEWMIRLHGDGDNPTALPDADCFDTVLQSWSRAAAASSSASSSASASASTAGASGKTLAEQAPYKAEQLLYVMEKLYESTGDARVKPRTLSFNAVLAAWAKSMTSTTAGPTKTGDGKGGNQDKAAAAADRACDILSFMELLDSRGDVTVAPDSASYSTVMSALGRTRRDPAGAARKADALLRRVEQGYYQSQQQQDEGEEGSEKQKKKKNDGRSSSVVVPDTILFNTAMGCWAKSHSPGAYRKARSILERQAELYESGGSAVAGCRPDVYGYTTVISSCTSESGNRQRKLKAFNVALATFRQLQQRQQQATGAAADTNKNSSSGGGNEGPNHVTYGAMLKACAKLLPASSPLRRKWAARIFQDCCREGMVGDMVLGRLRESVSPSDYRDLLQHHSLRNLPPEWTRNVNELSGFRKKKTPGNGNGSHSHSHSHSHSIKKRRRAEV